MSCPWTTPQRDHRRIVPRKEPHKSGRNGLVTTAIWTFCNDLCNLRRGDRRASKRAGAPFAVALLLALAALGGPVGATALGDGPNARASLAPTPCAGEHAMPNGRNAVQLDNAALCLMNEIRIAHGLPELHFNAKLARIASGQANDMVRGHYFSDQSLSGQSPLSRVLASGYAVNPSAIHLLTAQNIGYGTGPNATPAGIVKAWMLSPPHRKIILTAAYHDVGVGVARSVPSGLSSRWLGGTYAVEFGTRH
jgi:uncharacterized protein YkwD